MKTKHILYCALTLLLSLSGVSQSTDHSTYMLTTQCVSCHQMSSPTHLLVQPAKPPAGLPLEPSGKVGCITCHNCIAGTCSLRQQSPQLCSTCHDCTRGMACILGTAHIGDSPDVLRLSLTNCLGCHDGTVGTRVDTESHKVDILYIAGKRLNRITDGNIVLVNGRVTCVSCHNPYGGITDARLVKSNSGSRLCLSCHRT